MGTEVLMARLVVESYKVELPLVRSNRKAPKGQTCNSFMAKCLQWLTVFNTSTHLLLQTLPHIGKRVSKLEEEAAVLDASGEAEVTEYDKLKLEIARIENKMIAEITRPERILSFLLPGRLVKIREGGKIWGWGVVVNVVKRPPAAPGSLPAELASSCGNSYIVDILLHCTLSSSENGSQPKPCPPRLGEKGEMHADMGIEDPEIVELANNIEEHEHKLFSHPLHKLKGRAACLINTGDELLITELMFNGIFLDESRNNIFLNSFAMDHHQVAALSKVALSR